MINGKRGQGTHSTKICADKYPKCLKIYKPKLSAQAQKFGISMKKRLHSTTIVRAWYKFQLSPNHPPDLIAGTPLPVESENPKERKMMKKMLKKDACAATAATGAMQVLVQPQLLRKVCHIIAKAIAAEMSRKTERKWFVSSSSSSCSF